MNRSTSTNPMNDVAAPVMTGVAGAAKRGRGLAGLLAAAMLVAPEVPAQVLPQAPVEPAPVTLDRIQVLGKTRPLSGFPGAVSVVDGDALRDGQRRVSLSESLARVPGVTVLDRQNHAQDLQVQSRGFGARSTFGIRGVRLVVDGIPLSAADGQGQAASFPLDTLDRIEVLRGPLALQYGNAAGGAILGYTDLAQGPGQALEAWRGSQQSSRASVRIDGGLPDDAWRWRAHGSRFATAGERPHGAATRSNFSAVGEWRPTDGQRLRLALNALTQPGTQDPLGLTRAAWERDPQGTDAAAIAFDTRKSIKNHQLGLRWQHDYLPNREWWIGGYRVHRDVVQFLSVPPSAQAAPASAGGVIDLGRRSSGIDAGHRWSAANGSVAVGVEVARLDEARRGYENYVGDALGVRGRLRRDEHNRVDSREAYAIADYRPADRWTVLGAMRRTHLGFASSDRYVAAGNGDDSGRLEFRESAASLGVARAVAHGELFASVGRGFETPTITELAYRPGGGAGFNAALRPARFVSGEVGARWRAGAITGSFAAYRVHGEDEIVPAETAAGRASFANAGRTRRSGIELSLSGDLSQQWAFALAANLIDARFTEDFSYRLTRGAETDVRTVAAGNRIPGIARADGFAELAWAGEGRRLTAALEARGSGPVATDDRNSDAAAGHLRVSVRGAWRPGGAHGWHGFARVDNLFDRRYIGSLIVNDGNGRFFEPGAGRSVTVGIGWQARR